METLLNEAVSALKTLFANPIAATALACLVLGYLIRPAKWLSNDFIPPILFLAGGILFALIGDNGLFPPEAAHLGVWKFLAGSIVAFLTWTFHKAVLSRLEDKIPFLKGFVNWADERAEKPSDTGNLSVVFLAGTLSLLVGCSSFYGATVTLTKVVDSASKEYARADNDGLVSADIDAKVTRAHGLYQKSAKTAAEALRAYKLSGDPAQYDAAFEATRVAAIEFVNLIVPFVTKDVATDLRKKVSTVKQL